jgi:NitT/TauT family transport system substrate-binding protein
MSIRKALCLVALGVLMRAEARAEELTHVKVAWCNKTIDAGVAPYAVAMKMGWFKESGIEVELVPYGGSSECIQNLASKQVLFSDSTAEPLAAVHARGVKAKVFYTILQRNVFGYAVPVDSPIKAIADLKGKTVGVTSMGSSGVLVARAIAASSGLDPQKDINIVVAGQAGQTAVLLRNKQVDALSQFIPAYVLVERAGVKLRMLDNSLIARFPSNGLAALDETLKAQRRIAVALARGRAMGTLFFVENPEAAIKMTYDIYPQSRPTGRDEAAALEMETAVLTSMNFSQDVRPLGIASWGESSVPDYRSYLSFLRKWDIIKTDIPAEEFVTNELIPDINKFDTAAVEKFAKDYKN